MRLLDLFCGAGGASVGYQRAGFDVVGVDIKDQPRYPFGMLVRDAMDVLTNRRYLDTFDVVHASPPCQHYAAVTRWRGDHTDHPDLIPIVRDRLNAWGGTWIIENVQGAPLQAHQMLCGSMFGLPVRRHRWFETNPPTFTLTHPCQHRGLLPFMHKGERAYADAMGCGWMTNREAREAIPPAYTEHLGRQLIDHLAATDAER